MSEKGALEFFRRCVTPVLQALAFCRHRPPLRRRAFGVVPTLLETRIHGVQVPRCCGHPTRIPAMSSKELPALISLVAGEIVTALTPLDLNDDANDG